MTTYFKFFQRGMRATYGKNGAWPAPTADGPGEWTKVEPNIELCATGYHFTNIDGFWDWTAEELYIVEPAPDALVEQDSHSKFVCSQARLLRRVHEWNKQVLFGYAIDAVEHTLAIARPRGGGRQGEKWRAALALAREWVNNGCSQMLDAMNPILESRDKLAGRGGVWQTNGFEIDLVVDLLDAIWRSTPANRLVINTLGACENLLLRYRLPGWSVGSERRWQMKRLGELIPDVGIALAEARS